MVCLARVCTTFRHEHRPPVTGSYRPKAAAVDGEWRDSALPQYRTLRYQDPGCFEGLLLSQSGRLHLSGNPNYQSHEVW
jgi:hypothetical protein